MKPRNLTFVEEARVNALLDVARRWAHVLRSATYAFCLALVAALLGQFGFMLALMAYGLVAGCLALWRSTHALVVSGRIIFGPEHSLAEMRAMAEAHGR